MAGSRGMRGKVLMDTADDKTAVPAARSDPADLARLMVAARANTVDAMERLLETAQSGEQPKPLPTGMGYLLFVCAGRECAVPLSVLREVLPAVPRAVYLPFSPEWMLGIFPLRNEMVGLVDPVPVLTHRESSASSDVLEVATSPLALDSSSHGRSGAFAPERAPATALIVGSEERCLAWAVESVGDIALVQDDELHEPDESLLRGVPFARRYVAGMYTPHSAPAHAVVLDAEALLADLLGALDAGGEGHHG